MTHLARGPKTIHVQGLGPEDALSKVLREAFDEVLFFPDKTLPSTKPDLAICISSTSDAKEYLKWACAEQTPSLSLEVRNDAALIGPLTLSGRPGCGWCAIERLTAALATHDSDPRSSTTPTSEFSSSIAPFLIREINEIIADPKQSQLLDHVLFVDRETLDESLHKVIPLARCAVCGGAAVLSPQNQPLHLSPEDSPETVLQALAGWVDLQTGIVSDLFIESPEIELPIIATAAPPHVIESDGSLRRLPLGWGKGLTISGAILSAVGEAIERYSASIVDSERIVWKRTRDLDGEFLDPRESGLYSDEQYQRHDFPYVRFDEDIAHPWVRGSWAANNKPVWIPALVAFLSFELHQEQLICQGTSNGLAASTAKEDASLRAILELIERDAFMATWLTGSAAQRLELDDTLDPLLRVVLDGIERLGGTVEVYMLPASAIGTTILGLALGDGEDYPGVTFGLGCDLSPRAALKQAVLELGQTGPYLRRMMQGKFLTTPAEPTAVREMLDHAAYYFPKDRSTAFDKLRSGTSSRRLSDLNQVATRSFKDCVAELTAAEVRVALVDVTSADVATGPFRVMRAVSPDLQPIWYGYGMGRSPVERLRKMNLAAEVPPINPIW